ncbi:hypothetical protein [Telluribacter sp. SYSU D00476]|uniref:hypothetical protein n=1 Tax=Telluribacter sp. SYSU D00476 TaxID=2811430 RepID=UPI001FF624D4|nr:hypothetical protein [Telluribacter sp. SYSU D00476]
MKKVSYLFAALLLFIFINYGFYQWLQSGHTLGDAWKALWQDWLLAITFIDACTFSLLCIFWLVRDMKRRGLSLTKRTAILTAVIITGSVALLVYLAFRKMALSPAPDTTQSRVI